MNLRNDGVFEADADIDRGRRGQPPPGHSGEDLMTVAEGGIDLQQGRGQDENTPLLGGADVSHDGEGEGDGDGDGGRRTEEREWDVYADLERLPWHQRPSVFWMLPSFLLVALAIGGIIVPKLNLIMSLICHEYMAEKLLEDPDFTFLPIIFGGENPECRGLAEVQKRVAEFTLYGNLIAGLLSAVMSPKLGAISDRYGRTKVLVLTSCGSLTGEIITILAANYPGTISVNWILLGYVSEGLCGSFIASMALSHSYATDCTPPSKRAVSFAYFHGCLFTGIAIGPLIAGYIVKKTGSILTIFYMALGCHLLFIFFLAFVIPESLSKARQLAAREKHRLERARLGPSADWINQLRKFNLFESLKILRPSGSGASPALRRNLLLLAAVDTIIFGVAMGSMSVVVLYSGFQFDWDTYQSSRFVSIVNACRVFTLIVMLPIVTRLVRGRNRSDNGNDNNASDADARTTTPAPRRQRSAGCDFYDLSVIRFAIFCDTLGYLGYTLVRSGALFTLSGAIASIGGMGSPTLQSALTKHVPPDRTGQLLGAMGLLHALARVVAPTVFSGIYSVTVGKFTQTVFVCLTVTFGVAFACSWFVRPGVYYDEDVSHGERDEPGDPLAEEEERLL